MAFTLMVPGGKADRARTGLNALAESMPFLFEYINYSPKMVERVATIIKPYARFYKGKANNLVYNLCNWQWGILKKKILDSEHLTLPELRDVIMNHVRGFGYKATAHFIRNTGLGMPNEYGGFSSLTLPIIDVHIVKALTGLGFAVPPIAPGVGLNDRDYLALESNFSSLCNLLNIDISLLDAVLWCAYSDNWDMTRSDFDNYQT
jgi:thermostable 8-oxoguanine DNA glycosylase